MVLVAKLHGRRACLRSYLVTLAVTGVLSIPAVAQTTLWTRQFGTSELDFAWAVAADGTDVYVVGELNSRAFVRKYDAGGGELWTRQPEAPRVQGVAVVSTGVYVIGDTTGVLPGQTGSGEIDIFLRKYDANGNELWTRQFGSSKSDYEEAVAADATGVYVVGATKGALPGQTSSGGATDSFVRKYDPDGKDLWTRQFGNGSDGARGVAADGTNVYVVGEAHGALPGQTSSGTWDAYVRKYDAKGNELWTRQFGSASSAGASAVAVNATGVYVFGYTSSALPGQEQADTGREDEFVRKYDVGGNELWTRQFGTSGYDFSGGGAVDATGVYVVGTVNGALPGQTRSGAEDAFVRKYDASGAEQWTVQFGCKQLNTRGLGAAVDATGVYVAGYTDCPLPGQTYQWSDVLVVKLATGVPGPEVNVDGVVNNATFSTPVAPGSIAAVFGSNLNNGSTVLTPIRGGDGKLATSLGGTSVTVNNIPAPMFYSTPGQIGVQIPFEAAGQNPAALSVTVGGKTSAPRAVTLEAFAPGIFSLNQQGTGLAAVLHEDGLTPVTAENPAHPGEVVAFFATGLGAVMPALQTGVPSGGNQTVTAATVTIDGIQGVVTYSGTAPGFVGLNQVNVIVPSSAHKTANVPVVLNVGGKQSNSVTLPVR